MFLQEVFQLENSVSPADAKQSIAYIPADKDIETVTPSGKVITKEAGNTSIIVLNGDMTVAVRK